jgi:hypothetical protein
MMRKGKNQIQNQLVLEIDPVSPRALAVGYMEGLMEALADLLLEAMGAVGVPKKGGVDEHQNHA